MDGGIKKSKMVEKQANSIGQLAGWGSELILGAKCPSQWLRVSLHD